MKGVFITGTDTDVGKTWVGVRLIDALRSESINVIPRKPVESGWNQDIIKTDAWQIANAADKLDQLGDICPNHFTQIASPVRAAISEGHILSIEQLVSQCLNHLKQRDFLYVEGAGGFYSPLASDGLNMDLAKALGLPVVLIAENRLGCINQVLLSVQAIQSAGLNLSAIVLNQLSDSNKTRRIDADNNINDIKSYVNIPVIAVNYMEKEDKPFKQLAKLLLS